MPSVWIPGLLRDLTGGQQSVPAEGKTVWEVIQDLERRFPGIQTRLMEADSLSPAITVIVDGEPSALKLRQPLRADSEVHFLPAISGGEA